MTLGRGCYLGRAFVPPPPAGGAKVQPMRKLCACVKLATLASATWLLAGCPSAPAPKATTAARKTRVIAAQEASKPASNPAEPAILEPIYEGHDETMSATLVSHEGVLYFSRAHLNAEEQVGTELVAVPQAGGEPTVLARYPSYFTTVVPNVYRNWILLAMDSKLSGLSMRDGSVKTFVQGAIRFREPIVSAGDLAFAVGDHGGSRYVNDEVLWKVDLTGGTAKKFIDLKASSGVRTVGQSAQALALSNRYLFFVSQGEQAVVVRAPKAGGRPERRQLPQPPTPNDTDWEASVVTFGDDAYIAVNAANKVHVFAWRDGDAELGKLYQADGLYNSACALQVDDTHLYFSAGPAVKGVILSRIPRAGGQVAKLPTPPNSLGYEIILDGEYVYVLSHVVAKIWRLRK